MRCGIGLILSTSGNDHACSRAGQPKSHAEPETAIASGDECNAIAQVEELHHVRAHREVSGVLPALYRNLTPKGKIRGVPEADGYPTYLRKFECPNGLS
jgi:hypothetical protein